MSLVCLKVDTALWDGCMGVCWSFLSSSHMPSRRKLNLRRPRVAPYLDWLAPDVTPSCIALAVLFCGLLTVCQKGLCLFYICVTSLRFWLEQGFWVGRCGYLLHTLYDVRVLQRPELWRRESWNQVDGIFPFFRGERLFPDFQRRRDLDSRGFVSGPLLWSPPVVLWLCWQSCLFVSGRWVDCLYPIPAAEQIKIAVVSLVLPVRELCKEKKQKNEQKYPSCTLFNPSTWFVGRS